MFFAPPRTVSRLGGSGRCSSAATVTGELEQILFLNFGLHPARLDAACHFQCFARRRSFPNEVGHQQRSRTTKTRFAVERDDLAAIHSHLDQRAQIFCGAAAWHIHVNDWEEQTLESVRFQECIGQRMFCEGDEHRDSCRPQKRQVVVNVKQESGFRSARQLSFDQPAESTRTELIGGRGLGF